MATYNFAPNPSSNAAANQTLFADPRRALMQEMLKRGYNMNNWMVQSMLARNEELTPMALAYGAGAGTFEDFVNRYLTGQQQRGGQGEFSQGDINAVVQGRLQSGGDSDFNAWLGAVDKGADPEEQFNRLNAMQGLTQRMAAPQMAKARTALDAQNFDTWWLASHATGGVPTPGVSPTWLDRYRQIYNFGGTNPGTGTPPDTYQPPAAPAAVPGVPALAPPAPAVTTPGAPAATTTTPPAATPQGDRAPAAPPPGWAGFSPERGTVAGQPALVFRSIGDILGNQSRHQTSPGQSSMVLPGGWQYSAPDDTKRRYWVQGSTGREPGGAAKGASGWRQFTDWIANFTRNNPNANGNQVVGAAMAHLLNMAGGDYKQLAKFGFTRRV